MKLVKILPFVIITIGIFILSSISKLPISLDSFNFEDKVVHAFAYCAYGYAQFLALFAISKKMNFKLAFLIVILFGSIYAASDEFHQSFVPGRTCDFYDWCADFGGILFSGLIYFLINKIKFNEKRKK